MKLVLDANVIFPALLRGKPLSMFIELKNKGVELVTPDFLVEEFFKNAKKLAKVLGTTEEEAVVAFAKLTSDFVRVIPNVEYSQFLDEAKKISPDNKDVPYFAVSLKFDKCPLWSREPRLKRQKVVKVLDDKGVEELIKNSG